MPNETPVAVVTGASSGIGAATARRLADDGYAVALAARRKGRIESLADDLGRDRALPVQTDVTERGDADGLVDAVLDEWGRLDAVVNNAGLLRTTHLDDDEPEDLHDVVDVNLGGVMNVTHAAGDALREHDGDVVTVSSMNAEYPATRSSAYSASKAGANVFCESLRKQLEDDDVRVTVVMPGPVDTEMTDWSDWDGRELNPEDVADTIAFALSRPPHVEIPELTVNTTDKL